MITVDDLTKYPFKIELKMNTGSTITGEYILEQKLKAEITDGMQRSAELQMINKKTFDLV
jgi:hypothetical protein